MMDKLYELDEDEYMDIIKDRINYIIRDIGKEFFSFDGVNMYKFVFLTNEEVMHTLGRYKIERRSKNGGVVIGKITMLVSGTLDEVRDKKATRYFEIGYDETDYLFDYDGDYYAYILMDGDRKYVLDTTKDLALKQYKKDKKEIQRYMKEEIKRLLRKIERMQKNIEKNRKHLEKMI